MDTPLHKDLHDLSLRNKQLLTEKINCSCFYCLKNFNIDEVEEWVHENEDTAMCPYCDTDSVIPKTDEKILKEMKNFYFKNGGEIIDCGGIKFRLSRHLQF